MFIDLKVKDDFLPTWLKCEINHLREHRIFVGCFFGKSQKVLRLTSHQNISEESHQTNIAGSITGDIQISEDDNES